MARSCSAKPARTASRRRARPKAPESATGPPPARRDRSPRGRARSRAGAGRASATSTRGKASSAGGASRASARAAAAISATPSAPTTPDGAADPTDSPASAITLTRASALHPVGRRRVQREADIDVAGFLDQHDAAVRPERLAEATPRERMATLRPASRITVAGSRRPGLPSRPVAGHARIAVSRTPRTGAGSRATPVPPAPAGPCRS